MIGMLWQKGMLKLVLFSLLAFFFVIGLAPSASAAQGDLSIEGSLGVGTGPDGEEVDLGTGVGGGVGIGYELVDGLQARIDVSIYAWDEDEATTTTPGSGSTRIVDEELRNTEIFLGGRLLLPEVINISNVTPYVELGLSVNFLRAEKEVVLGGSIDSQTEHEVKIGVVPGIGLEFMATSNWGIGTGIQYHWMTDDVDDLDTEPSFFSWEALLNYHF